MAQFAARVLAVSLMAIVFASTALADDSVLIHFDGGYPLPGRSLEQLDLSIHRRGSAEPTKQADIDRYFERVRKILTDANIPPNWGWRMVDSPFVEMNIILDGKSYVVSSSYGSSGLILPQDMNEGDKRMAAAIQAVLTISVQRARAHIPAQ